MIPRFISNQLEQLSARYPIVAVTGPRQSGKTTLVRDTFPKKNMPRSKTRIYGNLRLPTPGDFFRPIRMALYWMRFNVPLISSLIFKPVLTRSARKGFIF